MNDLGKTVSTAYELKCCKAHLERVLRRLGDIYDWYETADRSAQSWADLDRLMMEEPEEKT